VARYLVAELVPTVAAIPFELEVSARSVATNCFDERAAFHRAAFGRPVPMILVDRERGVLLRMTGDVGTFDLAHHGVGGALSLQAVSKR
jgi:hypothetical protein